MEKIICLFSPTAPVSMTLGDLAGTTPASGAARYYATDHLGSTRSAWNGSKASVGAYEFDPYGGEYSHTGAALATLAGAYTGKPWDATAKLFHFPYRQYSPDMARWTTRDPLGMVDGPNVYGYVINNPTNRIDLSGLSIASWISDRSQGLLCGLGIVGCIGTAVLALTACTGTALTGGAGAPACYGALILLVSTCGAAIVLCAQCDAAREAAEPDIDWASWKN